MEAFIGKLCDELHNKNLLTQLQAIPSAPLEPPGFAKGTRLAGLKVGLFLSDRSIYHPIDTSRSEILSDRFELPGNQIEQSDWHRY